MGLTTLLGRFLLLSVYLSSTLVLARSTTHDRRFQFYHDDRHPVYKLFRRQNSTLPAVGSPQWTAAYPPQPATPGTLDLTKTPQEWLNALNAAVAAGKIPNIPVTTLTPTGPVYPNGLNPLSPDICSAYEKCMTDPRDFWNAPNGVIGIGFDDGPVANSTALYQFLKANNQVATHFMIGVNILHNPTIFLQAFNNGDDFAVHTYTHPPMTTLTNEGIVAEFGWSMQIIHDSTGGRLPKFWRPPTGDSDNRVRAIAQEVFGLTAIMWNHDTEDWSVNEGPPAGTTPAWIAGNLTNWISGPQSPGLIILEHELYTQTVQAFINAYPLMKSKGWTTTSVAQLAKSAVDNTTGNVWWNAPNGDTGAITKSMDILDAGAFAGSSAPAQSTTGTTIGTTTGASTSGGSSSTGTSSAASKTVSSSPPQQTTQKSGALSQYLPADFYAALVVIFVAMCTLV